MCRAVNTPLCVGRSAKVRGLLAATFNRLVKAVALAADEEGGGGGSIVCDSATGDREGMTPTDNGREGGDVEQDGEVGWVRGGDGDPLLGGALDML